VLNADPWPAVTKPGPIFDPRVKLAWLVAGAGMAVWRQEITFLVIQLMLILWLNRWAGLSWRRSVPLFKVTGIIGLQLMLLQGFMQPIGPRLFTVGGFGFFAGGAMLGLKGILVMGCLALLLFQFLFWTSAQEITLLLRKARLPFRYAFTAGMAVRFLPLLRQDLQSIYESQLSRGLRLDSFFMKIKGLPPIMIPLILKTLRRADAVALSMELKGFGRRPEVTQMAELKMGWRDLWAFGAIVVYVVLAVYRP
jgi:energy-coupling factor transport system permease protein